MLSTVLLILLFHGVVEVASTPTKINFTECPLVACTLDNTELNCARAGCFDVPNGTYTPDVTSLQLSHNNIRSIQKLEGFDKLQDLKISNNNLEEVEEGAFLECESLVELDLSDNLLPLAVVKNLTLNNNLRKISELNLNGNRLGNLSEESLFYDTKSTLEKLYLSRNGIVDIHINALDNLNRLNVLDLSHNSIVAVDLMHFQGLTQLDELYLNHNAITELKSRILNDCKSLSVLDLSNNRIKHVANNTFEGLEKLRDLRLNNNQLAVLQERLLLLPNLENVVLDNNPLINIEPDVFGASTTTISIQHCATLTIISRRVFANLPALTNVTIRHNPKLGEIDNEAFVLDDKKVSKLLTLDLSDNVLQTLTEDLVSDWSTITLLDLSGNQWDCDCHIEWMKTAPFSNASRKGVICYSPLHLKSISIDDIDASQFSCNLYDRFRRQGAIALVLAVTVAFVVGMTFLVRRCRHRLVPCVYEQGKQYQTLYNAREAKDDDEHSTPVEITFQDRSTPPPAIV